MGKLRAWILPGEAERDPGFRQEIERLNVRALLIISGVCVIMPSTAILFHGIAELFEPAPRPPGWFVPFTFAVAAIVAGLSRLDWGRRHARMIALTSGYVTAIALTLAEYASASSPDEALLTSMVDVAVVMLVAVVAGPFQPLQIFGLAIAINASHFLVSRIAHTQGLIPEISMHHYAGMDLFAFLCAALSAVLYQRLLEQYRSRRAQVEAQSRLLVSENAAAMGRFAATLTHELNTPLGALSSTLDSLEKVEQRRRSAGAENAARLSRSVDELIDTARSASEALRGTARRIERFTNLDRAEVTSVNLPQMLEDVAAMLSPELGPGVKVQVKCSRPVPLTLRPQQMSAVFARLLQYAAEAGPDCGTILLETDCQNDYAVATIRRGGTSPDKEDLANLFEPSFRVRGGRVAGANWSLFHSRQAVLEHGGDVEASAPPSGGLELTIRLPIESSLSDFAD